MGFFNWAAPLFHRADRRWTDEDVEAIAAQLRPFVARGGRLLDVGGGTGALAVRLRSLLGAHVTVLDATPEMMRYAPDDGSIDCVLGKAESMPFAAESIDAILVCDAFHHFRDQQGALAEFRRVLRPGGGVVVLELDASAAGTRLVGLVERLLGEPAAFLTPTQLSSLMTEVGIEGSSDRARGPSYWFVGRTESTGDVGARLSGA